MFDQLSELALLQAYWNDRHVHIVQAGRIVATGLCRVYEKIPWGDMAKKEPKIFANVKTYDDNWIREVPMNQLREIDESEYMVRKKKEVEP